MSGAVGRAGELLAGTWQADADEDSPWALEACSSQGCGPGAEGAGWTCRG